MSSVKVLIVDDSVVYRTQIRAALQLLPWVEVVGTASNGWTALDRVAQLKPDLLILDLEMPGLDGLKTLEQLQALDYRVKSLVFSAFSQRGAEITLEALRLGASDFIAKPGSESTGSDTPPLTPAERIKALLLPKIAALFPKVAQLQKITPPIREVAGFQKVIWDLIKPEIIVIGSSTGGPTVLERIFADLSAPLRCPIVIAQHMPAVFTATFADRLAKVSGLPVVEAKHGEELENNSVYIAPGDFHLRLNQSESGSVYMTLDQGPQINSVRPAVDPLFETAAAIYKQNCLGFILTGMGADGRVGAELIKKAGGAVVIQDEASCVVFGMPGAVYAAGAYDRIASPPEIVQIINDKAADKPISKRIVG